MSTITPHSPLNVLRNS